MCRENQPADNFYIIHQGTVEVALKRPDGSEVIVSRMGPGEYFGEIELLRGDHSIATVRAAEGPVEAVALPSETFVTLLEESDATREAVSHVVSQRVSENLAARRS